MRLEVLKYLADIDISLIQLLEYKTKVTTLDDFTENMMLKDAVERRLSIIGEALYQANKMDKDLPITNKKKIMGLRHILVHDYDRIKPEILFIIIKEDIELLVEEVKAILTKFPPQGSLNLDD